MYQQLAKNVLQVLRGSIDKVETIAGDLRFLNINSHIFGLLHLGELSTKAEQC